MGENLPRWGLSKVGRTIVKAVRMGVRPEVGLPAVYLGDFGEWRFKT